MADPGPSAQPVASTSHAPPVADVPVAGVPDVQDIHTYVTNLAQGIVQANVGQWVTAASSDSTKLETRSPLIAERMKKCHTAIIERVTKKFRTLLVLLASDWRLQTLQQQGKMPKTLDVHLPSLLIQTCDLTIEPSDEIKAMGQQISRELFDQLLRETTTQLKAISKEFIEALPVGTDAGFANWRALILRTQKPHPVDDFSSVDRSFTDLAASSFHTQIREGFLRLLWGVREALLDTTLQTKKRSFAVRQWLNRNHSVTVPESMDHDDDETARLQRRVDQLEAKLQTLMRAQRTGPRASDVRDPSSDPPSTGRKRRHHKKKSKNDEGPAPQTQPGRAGQQQKKNKGKGKQKKNN